MGFEGANVEFIPGGGVSTGYSQSVTLNFTRPANTTAYTARDRISSSTSVTTANQFASIARFAGNTAWLIGADMWITDLDSTDTLVNYRLMLWTAEPSTGVADNVSWDSALSSQQMDNYAGTLKFNSSNAEINKSDGTQGAVWYPATLETPILIDDNSVTFTTLFSVLMIMTGRTPNSAEQYNIRLWVEQN